VLCGEGDETRFSGGKKGERKSGEEDDDWWWRRLEHVLSFLFVCFRLTNRAKKRKKRWRSVQTKYFKLRL
jgi:hypothetical protein